MILAVHSDAGYLNERKAQSRAGGIFFLSNDVQNPPNNGAILTIAQIIDAVMASAAEAEVAALFINAREAVHMRRICMKWGILSHARRFKLITRRRRESLTRRSDQSTPKQWICVLNGYWIENSRVNLKSIGSRVKQI